MNPPSGKGIFVWLLDRCAGGDPVRLAAAFRFTGIAQSFTGTMATPSTDTQNTSDVAATSDITSSISIADTLTNDVIASAFWSTGGSSPTHDPLSSQTEDAEVANGTANKLSAYHQAGAGGAQVQDIDVSSFIEGFIHVAIRLPSAGVASQAIWYH